jgi:hypothetical protein
MLAERIKNQQAAHVRHYPAQRARLPAPFAPKYADDPILHRSTRLQFPEAFHEPATGAATSPAGKPPQQQSHEQRRQDYGEHSS